MAPVSDLPFHHGERQVSGTGQRMTSSRMRARDSRDLASSARRAFAGLHTCAAGASVRAFGRLWHCARTIQPCRMRRAERSGAAQVHARVGVPDRVLHVLKGFIRDAMPDVHRKFFVAQRIMYVATRAADGAAEASIVVGEPGACVQARALAGTRARTQR